ncbi:MAG: peptide chain release factor N(5)-glutamine methyltransferase [Bacteroidales bacterium]|nr:peptide chain release factor N(5)-glutamine methyltransferase [Bacteroidales bacterium]
MTLAELNSDIIRRLTASLGDREGKATARLVMEDTLQADPTRIFTRGEYELEPESVDRVNRIVGRIISGEPPQYAVGRARFMGLDLIVTPATLIPRPETAALVDMITDDYSGRTGLSILDIGTGSGCIAIALSRALPFADIEGVDISDDALAVARRNARMLNVNVNFRHLDILHAEPSAEPTYDIIVSNPPYIADSEKADMDKRVTDYEPARALFVPDNDPLEFYRAIADFAASALNDGGRLYFEINPRYASDLMTMLCKKGYSDVSVTRDYLGHERYARATYNRQ